MKKVILTSLIAISSSSLLAEVHTVTNSDDDGSGSLRDHVETALDGDTIYFDPSTNGNIIELTSGEIAYSKRLFIVGNGAQNTIIDGGSSSRIFNITSVDSAMIDYLTIQNGYSEGNGGGIFCENVLKVKLNGVQFFNNTTDLDGGAISSSSFAYPIRVFASYCTFSGNIALSDGGAVFCHNPNQNTYVYVDHSTFVSNEATRGGGIWCYADAGGWTATVSAINSTFINNVYSEQGGAIYASGGSSNVILKSSILAMNGLSNTYAAPDNVINSQGYNILDNESISGSHATDQLDVSEEDLQLGTLAYNTGSTQSILPGCGSVAIDLGTPDDFTDAQNQSIVDDRRDVGAAEYGAFSTIDLVECSPYTVPSGDETYVAYGEYTVYDTISSVCGADSVLTINLFVKDKTHTVSNSDDSGAGSLRQAVIDACPGDTILFSAGIDGTPIELTSGFIHINKNLVILGNGQESTIIDGTNNSRIFYISGGSAVELKGMKIQNGYTYVSNGGGIAADNAILDLDFITIENCEAADGKLGGALYLGDTEATINHSKFSGNLAEGSGGAIYQIYGGSLSLLNSLISGNVSNENGGGIYSPSPTEMELVNVTITGNFAQNQFGGIKNNYSATNSIIWGNDAVNDFPESDTANTTISYSILKGYSDIPGEGNINGTDENAPGFYSPIVAEATPSIDGDFRFNSLSPMVDAGLNSANDDTDDLNQNDRLIDGNDDGDLIIDLGAIEAENSMSINEAENTRISIYPNPFDNVILIDAETTVKQIELFSISGQSIASVLPNSNLTQFELDALERGVYFIKITTANNTITTHKVIKK